MKLHKTQGEWRRKLTSTRKYGPTHTDFIRTLEDLATLFAENARLTAQLAEAEAERDRQYEENVSQIVRYAALEAQRAEREGIARELADCLKDCLAEIEFYEDHVEDKAQPVKANAARAVLKRFHAAEGEG